MLEKYWGNPILSPSSYSWESLQTFNSGAILLKGRVHMLYRAIGDDYVSRFGYASSEDGFRIDERFPKPVYERFSTTTSFESFSPSGGGYYGCEDPRLIELDGRIYVTYTAFGPEELKVCLTSISVEDFLNKKWKWSYEKPISPPGEIHKNFVIFPERVDGKIAILHAISPKISIAYFDNLEFEYEYVESQYQPVSGNWEAVIKGCGPPPIKTEEGWLIFYHGIDRKDGNYKIGAMLLDLEKPEKVLCKSKTPVLSPDRWYETTGHKPGIVYTCGAVVKDGRLLLYYGAADTYVCVAHAWLDEFLSSLRREAD